MPVGRDDVGQCRFERDPGKELTTHDQRREAALRAITRDHDLSQRMPPNQRRSKDCPARTPTGQSGYPERNEIARGETATVWISPDRGAAGRE